MYAYARGVFRVYAVGRVFTMTPFSVSKTRVKLEEHWPQSQKWESLRDDLFKKPGESFSGDLTGSGLTSN